MTAFEQLAQVAKAFPYGLESESEAFSEELLGCGETFQQIAEQPALGGETGIAVTESAAAASRRMKKNSDAIFDGIAEIAAANAALTQARIDFANLPSVEVPTEVRDGLLSGGFITLGIGGVFTGSAGLLFLAAALVNRREREAIAALSALQTTLDAAATKLSNLLPKLEVPFPAEPTEIPDYPGDREESGMNGWQLGVEWLGGRGNERTFLEGDAFTELLRSHPFYNTMRKDLTDLAREGLLNVGDSSDPGNRTLDPRINVAFSLGGADGVKVFIQDFSTLLSGGQTGNLASTFLGSHSAAVQVIGQNPDGSYEVRIKVSNSTSLQSATRIPGIGYEDWYQESVGEFWNQLSSKTGIGKTTEQEITWTETIMP